MEGYEEKGKEMEGIKEGIRSPYFSGHVRSHFCHKLSVNCCIFPSDLHCDVHCFIIIRYQLCLINEADTWQLKIEMISQTRKKQLIHRTAFWLTGFCIDIYVDAETGQPERSTVEEYILPMKLSVF